MTLVVLRNGKFAPFCEAIKQPDLAADPKFETAVSRHEHSDILIPAINEAMSQETYKYWSERLTDTGIVHEVLNHYPNFPEHPEAKADNTGSWMDQPGLVGPAPVPSLAGITPPANVPPKGTSPLLEQHSCNILMKLDFSPDRIHALARERVISGPDLPTATA
ncbi:MAG: CoA transferase [Pseudomonadota bacterium]|nr:CoA transferase [Pseudomonadota bacterium]